MELYEQNENISYYLSDNDNITQKDIMMYRRPDTGGRGSDANNFKKQDIILHYRIPKTHQNTGLFLFYRFHPLG